VKRVFFRAVTAAFVSPVWHDSRSDIPVSQIEPNVLGLYRGTPLNAARQGGSRMDQQRGVRGKDHLRVSQGVFSPVVLARCVY